MPPSPRRVALLPAKRRALILDYLRSNGASPIGELAEAIGGSQSTARRDLEHLVEGGYLERTHGGAFLAPPLGATFEREPSINAQMRSAQKAAIGQAAAALLHPRDSVIFDASSTVTEAVRAAITRKIPLTVITNSIDIAQLCSGVAEWRVIMPGGTLRPGSGLLAGEPGDSFFKAVHADLCLTGAAAVTGSVLTDASLEVAAVKRAMIRSARRTVLLVDGSKFTAPAFCTFCDLSEVDEVITDDSADADALVALRSIHPKVAVVTVEPAAAPVDRAPRHRSAPTDDAGDGALHGAA